MKVHFAAGVHAPKFSPRHGWHNVDFTLGPNIQQRVDLLGEFPDNIRGITDAYVGHFLEHLYPEEVEPFLKRVLDRMAPGGRLVVVGPDAVLGERQHALGRIPQSLMEAIKAHGKPNGNNRAECHLWDCTGAQVADYAVATGWTNVRTYPIKGLHRVAPSVPVISIASWQFLVTAEAPAN